MSTTLTATRAQLIDARAYDAPQRLVSPVGSASDEGDLDVINNEFGFCIMASQCQGWGYSHIIKVLTTYPLYYLADVKYLRESWEYRD